MKSQRAWFFLLLLGAAACSTPHEAPLAVPGPYDTCSDDTDCAWGELSGEIVKVEHCPCVYGCPHLALAKSTVRRRETQYEALCDPMYAGDGKTCSVNDYCATSPRIACNNGVCGAAEAGAR